MVTKGSLPLAAASHGDRRAAAGRQRVPGVVAHDEPQPSRPGPVAGGAAGAPGDARRATLGLRQLKALLVSA